MNLKQVLDKITKLKEETQVKKEKEILASFLLILSDLKTNPLIQQKQELFEKALVQINLNSSAPNKSKSYNKELNKFMKSLRDDFNLIAKDYYRTHGIAFGIIMGISIGSVFIHSNGIAFGMIFGMAIGMAIGSSMDAKAQKQGRVYRTKEKN